MRRMKSWASRVSFIMSWVFVCSQSVPLAYASTTLREIGTDGSPGAERQLRDDTAWVWGPLGADPITSVGRANLVSIGKEVVSAAFTEGRALPLVGPGAKPVDELVELYAIGYVRRFGKPLSDEQRTALTKRIERVKTALERSVEGKPSASLVRIAPILDESGSAALVPQGVGRNPTHFALVAYAGYHAYDGWESAVDPILQATVGIGPMSAYPSFEHLEALLEQGEGEALNSVVAHEIADALRGHHEDEPKAVEEQINIASAKVFARAEQKKADAAAAAVRARQEVARKEAVTNAKRVQIVPYLMNLGQFFQGNRPPVYVLKAIEARLEQAAREGRITDSRVKPLGHLALLEVHYNGPQRNPKVDQLIINLVTEVIAHEGQQRTPADAQAAATAWQNLQALASNDVRNFREAIRKSQDPYYVLDNDAVTALQQAGLLSDGQLSDTARNVVNAATAGVNPFDRQATFQLPAVFPGAIQPVQMIAADQPFETLSYEARVQRLLQGPSGSFAFNHGGSEPVHVSIALDGGPAAFNWPIMKLLDEAVQNQLKIEGIRVNELRTLQAADGKKSAETMGKILELERELEEIKVLKAEQDKAQADIDRLQALKGKEAELTQALKEMATAVAKETELEGPGYVVVIERISDILEGKRERTSYRFVYPRSAPYIHTLCDDQTAWVITSVLPRPGSRRYNVDKAPDQQDPMLVVMVDPVPGAAQAGQSLNPVFIGLEQGGFPAMGEFTAATSQFYLTTSGAGVGTRHAGVIPVTAEEADSGAFADHGYVRIVSDAYMSYGTTRPEDKPGLIPHQEVHDQVGMTSDIRATRQKNLWLADELAMMGTFQPSVTAEEAEQRAHEAEAALGHRYHEIPAVILRDADGKPLQGPDGKPLVKVDPILEAANQKAVITLSDGKADIGATGHQSPYALQYAAFRASFNIAKRHGLIQNYDLGNAGDDNHFVLFHHRGVDDPEIHALWFTTFFRAGWLIHQLGYQLYGDMQDFVQPDIQQLIRERKLHVYANLDDEFMEELRKELEWMPEGGRWNEIQEGYQRVQGISVTVPEGPGMTLAQIMEDPNLVPAAAIQRGVDNRERIFRRDVQVFVQERSTDDQVHERAVTDEQGQIRADEISHVYPPGQQFIIRKAGRAIDFRLPGNVTGMGIGFAEKAFSKEEIERFGYASMTGNDKAASGAFNFGIYWALRLAVMAKKVYGEKTVPANRTTLMGDSIQELTPIFEQEVAERMPDLPAHLRSEVADRLLGAFSEVHDHAQSFAEWIKNGLAAELWHVAPGSRAFVEVEEEDPQLLALLSAQNEHNIKRVWVKKRKGWINDLTQDEIAALEVQVDQELSDNRAVFEERKRQITQDVELYEATRRERSPKGRALGTLNPWERMLYDQEIDEVIAAVRPKFLEVYKVRLFLGDDYMAAVSTEKLAAITQGNYVGKDDSVKGGIEPFFALYRGIAQRFVRFNVGNARGSQWPAMRPEKSPVAGGISKDAVAIQWSNSIEISWRYKISPDGTVEADPQTGLARREDMYGDESYGGSRFDAIRGKVADANLVLIQTQGGFTPHGPNVMRDIEAAYPARQTLESLIRPDSPFAYHVDDPTLTTIGHGKWGEQVLDVTDYALHPDVAGQAANPDDHRWVVLHSSLFTRPDSAIVQEQIKGQIKAALAGGASSIHFALAIEGAANARQAEDGFQALGLNRDDFLVVLPAEGDIDQALGVLEGTIRGSSIGGVAGPQVFAQAVRANCPNPAQVGVFVLEEEAAVAGPLIIGAVEAAATKNSRPPSIVAKLKEIDEGVFAPALAIGDIAADVQAGVRAYQEEVKTKLHLATQG